MIDDWTISKDGTMVAKVEDIERPGCGSGTVRMLSVVNLDAVRRPAKTAREMISELVRDVETLSPGIVAGCAGRDHPVFKDAGPRGLWSRLRDIEDAMDNESLSVETGESP
jgi:hypothetical protein